MLKNTKMVQIALLDLFTDFCKNNRVNECFARHHLVRRLRFIEIDYSGISTSSQGQAYQQKDHYKLHFHLETLHLVDTKLGIHIAFYSLMLKILILQYIMHIVHVFSSQLETIHSVIWSDYWFVQSKQHHEQFFWRMGKLCSH